MRLPVPSLYGLTLAASLSAACLAHAPAIAEEAAPQCPRAVEAAPGPRLDRLAEALKQRRGLRILAIGSSSTEGVGASAPSLAYPQRLQTVLAEMWPETRVEVVNAGKGGEGIGPTLGRLARRLADERYDLVLWQLGTNDAVRGEDEALFRSLARQGLRLIRDAGADALVIDPQDFPGIRDRTRYETFVAALAEEARQGQVTLFPRYRWMRDSSIGESLLARDRFHMGDRGYACLAGGLAQMIAALARSPRDPSPGLAAARPSR